MNYIDIDRYMEQHDFLPADVYKVHSFIEQQNRTRTVQFTDGILTRHELILRTKYGTTEEFNRLQLGIQENFI